MLSSTLGVGSTPTISAWMGSKVSPHADESRPDRLQNLRFQAEDTKVSSLASTETEANDRVRIGREDSMSSLESLGHTLTKAKENDGITETAKGMIRKKYMLEEATSETEVRPAQTRTQQKSGKKERASVINSFKWRPTSHSSDMSREDAEQLEKELHVEEIKRSLEDVLLEEDDMGI